MGVLVKMAKHQFASTSDSLFGLSMVRVVLQALTDARGESPRADGGGFLSRGVAPSAGVRLRISERAFLKPIRILDGILIGAS